MLRMQVIAEEYYVEIKSRTQCIMISHQFQKGSGYNNLDIKNRIYLEVNIPILTFAEGPSGNNP